MRSIFDFLRPKEFHAPTEPKMLAEYRIGVVVSNQGLNDKQLAELAARLDFVSRNVQASGFIGIFVPGFNMADAEESVPREVRNVLERKKGKQGSIVYLPTRGDHKDGVAEQIAYELKNRRCDEVWCFPAYGQTKNSPARVAQVYRLGGGAPHYKMIPPWVEPPVPPAKVPVKKPTSKGGPQWLKRKTSSR